MNRRGFLSTLWALASSSFSRALENISKQTFKVLSESKEISQEKLAEITANVFLDFGNEKMHNKVDKKQREKIFPILFSYFSEYPLCEISNEKVTFQLTSKQADNLAQTFMPSFLEVYGSFIKGLINFFGGSDEKIRTDFRDGTIQQNNLSKAKTRYIDDFWWLFKELNHSILQEAKKKGVPCGELTIGEYFTFITGIFPNSVITTYYRNLSPEYLNKPLSTLSTTVK